MISYINDLELKYEFEIVKQLREYNNEFSPQKPQSKKYFYAFDKDVLVGAVFTSVSWDWVGFRKLFYSDTLVLESLLSEVCKFYKNSVSGLKAHSSDKVRIDDFISCGFDMSGKIPGTSMGKDHYYADNISLNIVGKSQFRIVSSDSPLKEYEKYINQKVTMYETSIDMNKSSEIITFVALDNDEFVGGVQGEISNDSMYINLLVVNAGYRGKNIGTKLMNKLETEAITRGVVCVNLATSEFQAKEFYQKNGFKIIMERENNPKGYKCYTLIKWLST